MSVEVWPGKRWFMTLSPELRKRIITGSFGANGNVYGTTIVLGSIDKLTGNIDFHYEPGYKPNLPPYLQPFWQNSSGHLEVLLWREVKPRYQS